MASAWQARHGLTAEQYQATFDALLSQGFRLIDVCGYGVGGVDRYAAVWEQSPGPEWQARHRLSSADHQALFSTLPAQGYRPIRISGYDVGGADRYASLWQKTGGAEWRARHGISAAELQAEFDSLTPQGFRPIDVCGYTVAGQVRFAAIWDKSPVMHWVARHGLTSAEYQQLFTHMANHHYILQCVSGYEAGGQNLYAAVWTRGQALTWQARHGASAAHYQTEFDALLARGYRLTRVSGYPLAGEERYAGIWHKPYLSNEDETFIRQTVINLMTTYGVPGASVALAYQGRLVFAQGYGLANQANNEPVTPQHLFRIASLSKPITATAIFRMIETGLLNLQDRVFGTNGVLGTTFGTQPYGTNISQITVQHLLEHTSGWANAQDPMFDHFGLSQAQLITWMLDNETLTHVPGSRFEYLNFGYCLLGRIIETRSGLTYADYARQQVLTPSGISDMHIAGNLLTDRRANEVVYYTQSAWNPYAIEVARMDSHGGWIASARDIVRFLVSVDGFATRPDILSSGSIGVMSTPTTAPRPNGQPAGYAKGWATNAVGNRWHDGDLPGTAALLVRSHDQYCWAILLNSRRDAQLDAMRGDLDQLMWTILARITDWPAFDLF